MSEFMEAMAFRHACKRFDSGKKIPEAALGTILEAVRLSPSSFGMEPWRLIVVRSAELREALRPLCWNQPQITDCSELVIFTADNDAVRPGSGYVRQMFERRGLDPEATEKYIGVYGSHVGRFADDARTLQEWTAKQCYIAAANMMTCAASLRIDSCPIEGFEKEKVEACLQLPAGRSVALVVALGYRAGEQSACRRLGLDEIVSYR